MTTELSDRSQEALLTEGLTRRFGDVRAVEQLELSVRPGEIYGFLGRNGAGKTTTIRMMLGLIRPTAGRIRVFGVDVANDRERALQPIGCLVETATAYSSLTVGENLEIQRRLTGSPRESLERVITMFGLSEFVKRRAGKLSLGNKQRLALARALINRPRLLILDEPANALDPAGIVEIRTILRRFRDEEGISVFVSSHNLNEVAMLADRIGIIHRGRLVEELEMGGDEDTAVEIGVSDPRTAVRIIEEKLGLRAVETTATGTLVVRGGAAAAIAKAVVGGGVSLHLLRPMVNDLESRFLRITGGE